MCDTCGCSGESGQTSQSGHAHDSVHGHVHESGTVISLEQRLLAKNDDLAELNRAWLAERRICAVNLMSSPGAGKTTLLERTIAGLGESTIGVIEGDQETALDAGRIEAAGARVVQINTGSGCHLDATMVQAGLTKLDPQPGSLVFVENVGNLVCPALFDLGEAERVVILSVTEGADKPAKYPHMFQTASLVLLNKLDLLPYVDFDVEHCREQLLAINQNAGLLQLSATTGEGMDAWYGWLRDRLSG